MRANRSSSSASSVLTPTTPAALETTVLPPPPLSQHSILKLIRRVKNRVCADCSSVLIPHETYCSQSDLVWLCKACALVHNNSSSNNSSLILALVDPSLWQPLALTLIASTTNEDRNRVLERHVPQGWIKPTFGSTSEARDIWIRAKYSGRLFLWPSWEQKRNGLLQTQQQQPVSQKSLVSLPPEVLPSRLVDFFVAIGPLPATNATQNKWPLSCDDQKIIGGITFSCPQSQPDTSLPQMMGEFIFPLGMRYSSEEKPPQVVSFVLTDVSRVKLYVSALIFYELLEPEELASLLGVSIADLPAWPIVYTPRAIALLSHYPFWWGFSAALREIYHASLSPSPVPLERFVCNFALETPLPPLGQTEVVVTLAHKSLVLYRPPRNKLPGIDFSYRPLFTTLSVQSILTIFKVLMSEFSVCIVSENVSLLTPTQEAILSLLFPFVWQGCYIPVLPASMLELFEAPVPYLVGVSRACMPDKNHHPKAVLVVDIDQNVLSVGGMVLDVHECNTGTEALDPPAFTGDGPDPTDAHDESLEILLLLLEPMPKQTVKLKEKLMQHAGMIYRDPRSEVRTTLLQQVHLAYPLNEHLTPIKDFALAGGQAVSGTSHRLPMSCSYLYPGSRTNSSSSSNSSSLLDPQNNCLQGDGFDAREVRGAFLRFFVSLLSEHDEKEAKARPRGSVTTADRGSYSASAASSTSGFAARFSSSLFSRISASASAGRSSEDLTSAAAAHSSPAAHSSELLLDRILGTQMYSTFHDERVFHPTMHEIRLFHESCIEKKNRSKMNMAKSSTPFLSDTSEDVRETHTTPPPSNWGLSSTVFECTHFPSLNVDLIGPVRPPRLLLKVPDKPRGARTPMESGKSSRSIKTPSDPHLSPRTPASYIAFLAPMLSYGGQPDLATSTQDHTGTGLGLSFVMSTAASAANAHLEDLVARGREKHERLSKALSRAQALTRGFLVRRRWSVKCRAALRLQTIYRRHGARRQLQQKFALRLAQMNLLKVKQVQFFVRFAVARMRYLRFHYAVVYLQSQYRRRRAAAQTRALRAARHRAHSWLLARLVRQRSRRDLGARLERYSRQVVLLWAVCGTPLWYRSNFLESFMAASSPPSRVSHLSVAIVSNELARLHTLLGLSLPPARNGSNKRSGAVTAAELERQYVSVEGGPTMVALRASSTITQSQQIHWGKVDATLRSPVAAAVSLSRQALFLERRALYLRLTSFNEAQRSAFYDQLGLDTRKKRKLLLSQTVWSGLSFEHARNSAQVICKVNAAALNDLKKALVTSAATSSGGGSGFGSGSGGMFGIGIGIGRRSGGGSNADGLVEHCVGLGLGLGAGAGVGAGVGIGAEAGVDVGREAWASRVLAEYSHRAHRYAVCAMLQRGKG